MDTPTYSTSVSGRRVPPVSLAEDAPAASPIVTVHYVVVPKPKVQIPHPARMPFTLSDLSSDVTGYLERWYQSSQDITPIHDLVFATLYMPDAYLESRFLQVMQALESYHRKRMPGMLLPKEEFRSLLKDMRQIVKTSELGLRADMRKAFTDKLSYLNELPLRLRLEALCALLGDAATAVVPDPRAFVVQACDTRNYLTHYSPHLQRRAANVSALGALYRQAHALAKCLLMCELGLPSEKLVKIATRLGS